MKEKIFFACTECGHKETRWLGRCPECGTWNSLEEIKSKKNQKDNSVSEDDKIPIPLTAVDMEEETRFDSGIDELNRVLGGGIMKGSTVLVGGEPGIGKSTLMLQLAAKIKTKGRILYVTGEESLRQVKMRAERLQAGRATIEVFCETNLSAIIRAIDTIKPVLVIIDSIQMIYSSDIGSIPGTPTQVKLCTYELNDYVKSRSAGLFLIGHVTKEGIIAGPKVVEHLVDTVLYFDQAESDIRILRATKNRFGPTHELGLFQMTGTGLAQVKDPGSLFLEHRDGTIPPGVVIAPVFEGTRVLMVEIQSLVVPAKGGISRVFSDKIDSRRVSRLAAVLEKHLKIPFFDADIYVNVAGGLKVAEVGIDLAICISLYSAKTDLTLPPLTAVFGEVSLAGEIRPVSHIDRRCKAALDMGYEHIYGPTIKEGGSVNLTDITDNYKEYFALQDVIRGVFAGDNANKT
ncbi:MAG: DNA repair protein RadA [Spirochaetales bacterium]|nr:DNA repair protein RadA [Spirochaetales bacterium]